MFIRRYGGFARPFLYRHQLGKVKAKSQHQENHHQNQQIRNMGNSAAAKPATAPQPEPMPILSVREAPAAKPRPTPKEAKPKIGLLPPQEYMASEIELLRQDFEVTIIDIEEGNWDQDAIDYWVRFCKDNGIPAVCGFAQKDAWHHALINSDLGNVTISPLAFLLAMNKYMQRVIEPNSFWFIPIDPAKMSNEEIVAAVPETEWPFMLKNTSLSLGRGVFRCKTGDDVHNIIDRYRANERLQREIRKTNESIISRMTEEEKNQIEEVPPFIGEHMVDMTKGWIEYTVEGCVTEEGGHHLYGLTEEIYFDDHQSLGYITPPVSFKHEFIPHLEKYINTYMNELIPLGYKKQFYNIEFWASTFNDPENPDFAFTEINPRCAHTFHFGYKFAYGTNLYRDNWNLVLNNQVPENSPWKAWKEGGNKISLEILITSKQVGVVSDILDYDYIDHIEQNEVELIRHIKSRDYVMTPDDAASGAGLTLLQIWITTDTFQEAAAREMEIRKNIYKQDMGWESKYPKFWLQLASQA